MDQTYVCTQCGEESDSQGPCPMCGLPMIAAQSDSSLDDDDTSFDDGLEMSGEKEYDDEDKEGPSYNPYDE